MIPQNDYSPGPGETELEIQSRRNAVATEPLMSGSERRPCSPSSETPETDANTYRASTLASADHIIPVVHAEFARKMERQRNEAFAILREILKRDEAATAELAAIIDGYEPEPEYLELNRRIMAILPENKVDQGQP